MKINELFSIEYPKTLIFSEMVQCKNGVNFVSSQDKNNGVVAKVAEIDGVKHFINQNHFGHQMM